MEIIVAGCGGVGSRLAGYLVDEGQKVVVVDRDPGSLANLPKPFRGTTLVGDVMKEAVLVKAGIKKAGGFAAVTQFDDTNLAISESAQFRYKVGKVVARLVNPEQETAFARKDIEYFDSTTMIASRIRSQLFQSPDSIVQQDRSEVGIQVIEFGIGEQAAGKPVGNLTYGISSRLLVLLRNGKVVPFVDETPLVKGDRALMTLRKEGWRVVKRCMGSDLDESACRGALAFGLASDALDEVATSWKVLVAGCSQVGAYLARLLDEEGHHVTLIDLDPALFERVSKDYKGDFVEGDIFAPEVLEKAGIREADAFAAVSKSDEANLKAVQAARGDFGVQHVVSRVFEPSEEPAYQALGMPYVCGTRMLALAIGESLLNPTVRSLSSCMFNQYDLVEFECPRGWEGKRVRVASNAAKVTFAYIVRRSTGYMPEENFVLREGDAISALVTPRRLRRLEKTLLRLR
ncbi:MAG: NAD-binding protein [Actinobacteria bacterium]|nr:NAD-binding protein [Actinomycetota bacterium]MBU1945183.1 NAD-binding protein [Actinomycetota bacterium]MBU2687721.1 NAD-binding protein [Actinomycetota bacterium]